MKGLTARRNRVQCGAMCISRADRLRLAAETGCDPRTVERWAEGGPPTEVVRLALARAARRLDIELPGPKQDDAAAS